jgi:thiol-disulfide isomerase/thioredoxin
VVTLEDLRGQVVVLDFWATWCGPCRESLPAIDRVYRRHREQGLALVSINTDDPVKARAMLRSMGISVPLYVDDGTVAERYGVSTIPHLVILDRMGMVRHVHRGFDGESTLDAQVTALLRTPR